MGDIVFLLFLGAFICGVVFLCYKFCQILYKGYKKNQQVKAFLADLKSNGIKPKIINATLSGGYINVYAENYGLIWRYTTWWLKHDSDDSSRNRTGTSGTITARDLHWNEDTVTATFDGRDKYGNLIQSQTVTLNVYREIL